MFGWAVPVDRLDGTFLIEVTARTSDPALSAELANAIASGYIADQRRVKVDSGAGAIGARSGGTKRSACRRSIAAGARASENPV